MHWNLSGVNLEVTGAMRRYADKRVVQPLSRLGGHVRSLRLWLRRDGRRQNDQVGEVRAVVTLSNGQVVAINEQDRCYYSALDLVADRVKETVRRRVERRQTRKRSRTPLGRAFA